MIFISFSISHIQIEAFQKTNREKEKKMSNCVRLAKKVLKLSENQPMGAIQDADTVLADIMGKSDFQVTRISDELLKMYLDVENKDDFESLFFLIADETFEEYLTKSRDVMQKNINYGTPRVVKVILNDGKFSIFKTDAPEEEIKKYLERFCKITERSIGMFFQNFLLEGHTVQVLYLSNNQHFDQQAKERAISYPCTEVYQLQNYDMENAFKHKGILKELFCENIHGDLSKSEIVEFKEVSHNSTINILEKLGIFKVSLNEFHMAKKDSTDVKKAMKIAYRFNYRVFIFDNKLGFSRKN